MSDPAPGASRRRILLLATAGAAGALAGACSTKPSASNVPLSRRSPAAGADVEPLIGLLELERYAVAAYSAGIPLTGRGVARAGKQFLNQELSHAGELEGLIAQAGGKPPPRPAFYDLGQPRDERQVLELWHRVERGQLARYLSALPRLHPPRLRAAVAAIMANEAQHAAVVRSHLGLTPVPAALVSGRE